MPKDEKALIIGAGPAGLTAGLELLRKSNIKPIILEKSSLIGGISKTLRFGEDKMDLGGHRFFSKSDKIIDWWLEILPLDKKSSNIHSLTYHNEKKNVDISNKSDKDGSMLIRSRKSRIFYDNKFYDYPISLNYRLFINLGIIKTFKIGFYYIKSLLLPIKPELTLEDFFINRFGKELYQTFFKSYTEKVWGKQCKDINAEWGYQRIKGLSVWKTIYDAVRKIFKKSDINQKDKETSLIEYFMYPKEGPGQMWETVAEEIIKLGGEIHLNVNLQKVNIENNKVDSVTFFENSIIKSMDCDYLFSSASIKELIAYIYPVTEKDVLRISQSLEYRDFLTVGVLLKENKILSRIKDNWIYIHDPKAEVGRIQFFHNWSPYMVKSKGKVLLGLEYFCNSEDKIWKSEDKDIVKLAIKDLKIIGLLDEERILDYKVERVEKAYPSYTGSYDNFDIIKSYINSIENLYPIGRNGMHRYNNQDHSMMTAIESVDCILNNKNKSQIWNINLENNYHETK